MNDDLLDAVDLLTKDRFIGTWVPDSAGELRVHTEKHPPLLRLLIDGIGIPSSRGPSSEIKIPIDAEALELCAQISDRVRLWCRSLRVAFDGDGLLSTLRRWYLHHANRVRSGQVSDVIDAEITSTVQSWVRMIESKYEPVEIREWQDACVAEVAGEDGHKCGARRILINGIEQFAIELNVTTLTATCRQCGHEWVGRDGLSELRFLTNLDNQLQTGGTIDGAAINIVTNRRR